MSDCVEDIPDGRRVSSVCEITEVLDDLSIEDTITNLPRRSEEMYNPEYLDSEWSLSPRTYRKPDETSNLKKSSNKWNWKKKIANSFSKIGISGKKSSSARLQKCPSFAEFNVEARTSEMDELSRLFSTSEKDKDKKARPPSWRKILMCTSMRLPDEDNFTADRSLQHYIDSWN